MEGDDVNELNRAKARYPRCAVCAARLRSLTAYALHRAAHVLRGEVRTPKKHSDQGI